MDFPNIATLKSRISELSPNLADSTICWTCVRACSCRLRHSVGEETKIGVKVTSCSKYKRDSLSIKQYIAIAGITARAFLDNKEEIKAFLLKAGYKLDYVPRKRRKLKNEKTPNDKKVLKG